MWTRRRFLMQSALLAAAATANGGGYLYAERHFCVVEKVPIQVPGLPPALDGLKIAQLSDFHLRPFTTLTEIERAVRQTNALAPDLVALTGDFITGDLSAMEELAPALAKLQARLGVFCVIGNHDCWHGARQVIHALEQSGLPTLRNTGVELSENGAPFYLAGLDSAWAGRPNLARALEARRSPMPTVLLVHEPDFGDLVPDDAGIALQLSGHSHGGQVRLPIVGAMRTPSWGNKYVQGLYRRGPLQIYTNRGVGVTGVPLRVLCPPEITEITLHA